MKSKIQIFFLLQLLVLVLSSNGSELSQPKLPVQKNSTHADISLSNITPAMLMNDTVHPALIQFNTTMQPPKTPSNPTDVPVPAPSTVPPNSTPASKVTTQITPTTQITSKPTTVSTLPPPPPPPSTTPAPAPTKPPMTTSSVTTEPTTPKALDPSTPSTRERGFDGPSFIGGIVLTLGLTAIAFIAFKFYKADRAAKSENYRKL